MQKRLPAWVVNKYSQSPNILRVKSKLRRQGLHTVCESARCPNQGECFAKRRVTFLIMGDRCTRACRFCAVEKGAPYPIDETESQRVAQACKAFGLQYVVITSVTRDDLPDGGAEHFAHTVLAIREKVPAIKIEVLTPDFKGRQDALTTVASASPNVWGHNLETVAELYPVVRAGADYKQSLDILNWIKQHAPSIYTKSGIMLGLGEKKAQVMRVLEDLREVDCDFLTIGQYLQPTRKSLSVKEYITPAVFEDYRKTAITMGFRQVVSQPLARSSYQPLNKEETDMDCVFCKIIEGEIPSYKLYEDEEVVAFLDAFPANVGHTLILPKAHYKDLSQTPENLLLKTMKVAQKLAPAITQAMRADGFNLFLNDGRVAGQLIDHLHLHILPRSAGDNLKIHLPQKPYPEGEAEKVKQQILDALEED